MIVKRVLPGHCIAIMLAAWRGQSLVPSRRVLGLERALKPSLHPELVAIEAAAKQAAFIASMPPPLECDCGHPDHYYHVPFDTMQLDPLVIA